MNEKHIIPDDMELGRIRRVHFVGIGGAGMGGIAEVLLNQGYAVAGSDRSENAMTRRLQSLGATVHLGHDAAHIDNADAVVISSAVAADNPEVLAARERRLPIVPRAEMLAEIMRFRYGIAIAGTHGKTTTTSLIASLLAEAGLDPTFVIGGKLNSAGTNARLGTSRYFVAEADESDASFLYLKPMMSVVTNIDADHLGTYDDSFDKLRDTFLTFLHHLPFYGLAILCVDDPVVCEVLPNVARPMITYGFAPQADVRAIDHQQRGLQNHFTVLRKNREPLPVILNMPGTHNVQNALAAIAIASELNVADSVIQRALLQFAGVGRRLQIYGEYPIAEGAVTLIDDYGHHPREISATLESIRKAWPERRLVMTYQPHRFTRTRDLFEDFSRVLSTVDVLLMLDIYSAGEPPITNIDSRSLCRNIRQHNKVDPVFVGAIEALPQTLTHVLQDGDILLMQGAGDIGAMATRLAEACAEKPA